MFELEVSGYPTSSNRSLKYSALLKGLPLFKNALTNFTLNNLVVEGSVSPFWMVLIVILCNGLSNVVVFLVVQQPLFFVLLVFFA